MAYPIAAPRESSITIVLSQYGPADAPWRRSSSSEPAAFVGDADRFGAVSGAGLGDGCRKVVANRALGQVQGGGDVGHGGATTGGGEDVALPARQWRRAASQGRG